jgi:hypothetical protein
MKAIKLQHRVTRTRVNCCKDRRSFAVVSPGTSGQTTAGIRAPMLGKWPNPNRLSEMSAWARGLWIRRVLVHLRWPWLEPRRGNSKALHHFGGVEPTSVSPAATVSPAGQPRDGSPAGPATPSPSTSWPRRRAASSRCSGGERGARRLWGGQRDRVDGECGLPLLLEYPGTEM